MNDKELAKKDKSTIDESDYKDLPHPDAIKMLIGLEATLQLMPVYAATKAMSKIHWGADSKAAEQSLTDGLKKQHKLLQKGDLSGIEAMLVDQTFVLNSMFSRYVILGSEAERFSSFQEYYRTALKAQNQCRRTITTLVDLKSPKRSATFIKQQNVGINQQINDGQAPIEIPEKKENPANKLLEENHDARLDTGTPQEAGKGNQEVETVGKIDRAED